jgi:hypothetical protein
MVAAAFGSIQAMDALLAAGADVRCCTPTGCTALGRALAIGRCAAAQWLYERVQQEPDCEAILAAAVKHASPSLGYNNRLCSTPLAIAAEQGYHQLVPLLVTPGNLNLPSAGGKLTPLHVAFKNNHIKAAEALLDAGAAVNIPNSLGRIPLAFAVQRSNTQLNVRLLQLMKQQHPAAAGEAALMESVITAAAWLGKRLGHVHSAAKLFAAVLEAWGPSAAVNLLQGVLKHLGDKPHYLADILLVAWRRAQQETQLQTHFLLERLQRLVLDPGASSRQQQQHPLPKPVRALRLRLPLALLLNKAGPSQGQGPGATSDTTLASQLADLSLGTTTTTSSSSQADALAAAARCGNMPEVAALLAAVSPSQLPAALLAAAQAAGAAGHHHLSRALLQQFTVMDWEVSTCSNKVAPLAGMVRAAVEASAPPPSSASTAAATAAAVTAPAATPPAAAGASSGGSGQPFCLYRALLDSWLAVPQMVGLELAAQVVEAVELATARAEGEA